MNRSVVLVSFVSSVAFGASCATKSLPPGTPPPEYEERQLEPWPPADAGAADAAAPNAPSEAEPSAPGQPDPPAQEPPAVP